MNYSELLQLAKGWGNFVSDRIIIWRLPIKSNWTLEQLGWKLYEAGDYAQYDGLTGLFIKLVSGDEGLLRDDYIRRWYKLSLEQRPGSGKL